ncbi:alpha/beta fold hydrolase [Stappia sp. ICDLI1TA098]
MTCLHVRRDGRSRPGARPLVLLHGWSCHGGFFAPQMTAFASRTLVLAPDLPGHGESAAFPAPTIEAAADALADLLDREDLSDVVLSGWSMGALVAWSLIARHGTARIARLVVEDMSPKVINTPDWPHGSLNGLDAARNLVFLRAIGSQWPRLAPATARRCFAADADPALVAWTEAEIRKADPLRLAAMWHSLTAQDFRPLMPRLDIPVTLAHGARSQLYSAETALWQAGQLPEARVLSFAASGHAPHLEESLAFNEMLGEQVFQ